MYLKRLEEDTKLGGEEDDGGSGRGRKRGQILSKYVVGNYSVL